MTAAAAATGDLHPHARTHRSQRQQVAHGEVLELGDRRAPGVPDPAVGCDRGGLPGAGRGGDRVRLIGGGPEPGGIADAAGVAGIARGSGSAVFLLLGLWTAVGSLRIRGPITENSWLELRIALDTPFVPRARTAVRLTGWALYPDGRQTRFRLTADISLAANVAVTGQLGLLGYPPPGKPAKSGLPGRPCLGSFRPA